MDRSLHQSKTAAKTQKHKSVIKEEDFSQTLCGLSRNQKSIMLSKMINLKQIMSEIIFHLNTEQKSPTKPVP